MEIIEENGYFINNSAIGEISIKELEKEAINAHSSILITIEENSSITRCI